MVSYIFYKQECHLEDFSKVLFKLKNKTVLEQAVSNLKKDKIKKRKIIVLTSKNKSDNKIVQHCKKKKNSSFSR